MEKVFCFPKHKGRPTHRPSPSLRHSLTCFAPYVTNSNDLSGFSFWEMARPASPNAASPDANGFCEDFFGAFFLFCSTKTRNGLNNAPQTAGTAACALGKDTNGPLLFVFFTLFVPPVCFRQSHRNTVCLSSLPTVNKCSPFGENASATNDRAYPRRSVTLIPIKESVSLVCANSVGI